jgi:CRP-like cAMP-binding protein
MTKAALQDLSVLSSSKQGLIYLTANDWALIADKASRVQFPAGDTIVARGRMVDGIYLILKGRAKVLLPTQAASRVIAAGEICGELSFLDELQASANVVADAEVDAFFLDRTTLQSLFELFPHLASRFYRSLATNLARRLREMIESKPSKAPQT